MNLMNEFKQEKDDLTFEEDMIDVKKVVNYILKRCWWFVFTLPVCIALSVLYLYHTPNSYLTIAKINVNDQQKVSGEGSSELMGGMDVFSGLSMQSDAENEIEVFSSTSLIRDVVLNRRLYTEQYYVEEYREIPVSGTLPLDVEVVDPFVLRDTTFFLLPKDDKTCILKDATKEKSFSYQYGKALIIGGTLVKINRVEDFGSAQAIRIKLSNLKSVIGSYKSKISILQVGLTNAIAFSYTGSSPQQGEALLKEIVDCYNRNEILYNKRIGEVAYEFINTRLKVIDDRLVDLESLLEEFKVNNKLTDIATQSSILIGKESMVDEQIFGYETELKVYDLIYSFLDGEEDGNFSVLPDNISLGAGSVGGNIQVYNTMVIERAALIQSAGADNAGIRNIDSQLAMLTKSIRQSLENAKEGIEIKMAQAKREKREISNMLVSAPTVERQYRTIVREQKLTENLYLYLLERLEEARISMESHSDKARVIEEPFTSTVPQGLDRMSVLLIGIAAGFGIPIILMMLLMFLDDKVYVKDDLGRIVNTIPYLGNTVRRKKRYLKRDRLLYQKDLEDYHIFEGFSMVRENLNFLPAYKKEGSKVLAITSSIAGEGKTYTAVNLAFNYAKMGKKCVIIGFDIRKPSLHLTFQSVSNEFGLSNFLSGRVDDIFSILQPSGIHDNIDVLTAGPASPNSLLMINNNSMIEKLISELKDKYDYVILDTPPTILPDALALSVYSDIVLYVCRSGVLPKSYLEDIYEMHSQAKLKNMAIIITDVDRRNARKYKYTYEYK